jgi:hypothetical protein
MGRLEKMEEGAHEAGFLEPDETIEAFTLAKNAYPLGKGLTLPSISPYTLLATSRKLYGVRRGQIGFGNFKEVILEVPIEEAYIEKVNRFLIKVGPFGEENRWAFNLEGWNTGLKQLLPYVKARSQVPQPVGGK